MTTWAGVPEAAESRGELRAHADCTLMGKACWAYTWQAVTLLLRVEPPRVEEAVSVDRALIEQLLDGWRAGG